jgi:hypothetical protein
VAILAPPAVALAAAVAASGGISLDPAAEPEEFIRLLGKLTPAQRQALQRRLFAFAVALAGLCIHGKVGLLFEVIGLMLALIDVLDAIDKK